MKYNLEHCIGNRLRTLSRIVDNQFRATLKEFNITESQLSILFALKKTGEIEQGKIGTALVLDRSTVSRNVKLLEKRDFIQRSTDYRPMIALTTQGEKLVQQLLPHWEILMDNLIDQLGQEGMEGIKSLEKKLR